jgi:hypothetical protein
MSNKFEEDIANLFRNIKRTTYSNIFDLKTEVNADLDNKIDATLANDVSYLINWFIKLLCQLLLIQVEE